MHRLNELYNQAIKENREPMRPADAARHNCMSSRTVYRFLQSGLVLTPAGHVPFTRDANGHVSAVRLGCIKALRDEERPGRKYGTRFRLRRGANANDRKRPVVVRSDGVWRLARILTMIDNVHDRDSMQRIKEFAAKKFHRM